MYPTAPPGPPRTPGTVVALRILAWIQVGGLGLLVGAGVLLAGFSSFGLSNDDELTQGFATLGVFAGILFAGFAAVLIVAVAVPTALLRTGRRSRRTGALVALTVVEGLFVVVQLLWTLSSLAGRSPADALFPLLLTALPVAVLVLALHPASRAWAAVDPTVVGPWGPPPPPPVWNGGPPPPPVGWVQPPPTPPASPWARPD